MKWYDWVLKILELLSIIGKDHVDKKNKKR